MGSDGEFEKRLAELRAGKRKPLTPQEKKYVTDIAELVARHNEIHEKDRNREERLRRLKFLESAKDTLYSDSEERDAVWKKAIKPLTPIQQEVLIWAFEEELEGLVGTKGMDMQGSPQFIGKYDSWPEIDQSKTFLEYFSKFPWADPEIETKIVEIEKPSWWTPQHHDLLKKKGIIFGPFHEDEFHEDDGFIPDIWEDKKEEFDLEKEKENRELAGDEYYERFKESRDKSGKAFITPELRQDVLQRDKFTCQHCGRSAPDVVLHIDHVIPESKGGPTELDNLQVLCEECNMGKGNKYYK